MTARIKHALDRSSKHKAIPLVEKQQQGTASTSKMTLAERYFAKLLESGIHGCKRARKGKDDDCGYSDLQGAFAILRDVLGRHSNHKDAARTHYWMGRSSFQSKNYQRAIQHYRQAIHIQESVVGRYHDDTFAAYHFLGLTYLELADYEEALIAFRASLRIQHALYGLMGAMPGDLSTDVQLYKLLVDIGQLSDEAYSEHRRDMAKSLQSETAGDASRRKGDLSAALDHYEKAIHMEDSLFGSYNVNLAMLWRKLACCKCQKKTSSSPPCPTIWLEADLVSKTWIKDVKKQHSQSTTISSYASYILRGDKQYHEQKYEAAIAEYRKVMAGTSSTSSLSSSKASSIHRSNLAKTSKKAASMAAKSTKKGLTQLSHKFFSANGKPTSSRKLAEDPPSTSEEDISSPPASSTQLDKENASNAKPIVMPSTPTPLVSSSAKRFAAATPSSLPSPIDELHTPRSSNSRMPSSSSLISRDSTVVVSTAPPLRPSSLSSRGTTSTSRTAKSWILSGPDGE